MLFIPRGPLPAPTRPARGRRWSPCASFAALRRWWKTGRHYRPEQCYMRGWGGFRAE